MLEVAIKQRLTGLDLDVTFATAGGVTAIFGPSGAGKTSILRAVAGLGAADQVRLTLDGIDLSALPPAQRRIGYVFQEPRLFPHMSVAQNLRYGGQHDADRITAMLELAPLLSRRPGNLSGGEARRVAIGRALMSNPRLLLLDEPLTNLDAPRKAAILPYLERLRDDAGLPILFVSHDLSEVTRLAHHLVVLKAGQVAAAGPLSQVMRDPAAAEALGPRQAGVVIAGTVDSHDASGDLTALSCPGGKILIPGEVGVAGAAVRLRVYAHDIILARERPQATSALNILQVTVTALHRTQGGVDVTLSWGPDALLARVTRRSAATMDLQAGDQIFAMVKASSVGAG